MAKKKNKFSFKIGFRIGKSFINIYKKYFAEIKKFSSFIERKVINTTQVKWKEISKYSILILGIIIGIMFFIFLLQLRYLMSHQNKIK